MDNRKPLASMWLLPRFKKFIQGYMRHGLVVPLGLLISVLFIAGLMLSGTGNKSSSDYYQSVSKMDIERAEVVFDAGIYIQKLYDLDLQSKTFSADGYAWISWTGNLETWDDRTKQKPADTLEFLNAVDKDSFKETLSPDSPYKDELGRWYQSKVFSGRFLASDIDLKRFPFETIRLPVIIESDDFWINEAIMLVNKSGGSGVSNMNSLNGYSYDDLKVASRKHVYTTAFGLDHDSLKAFGKNQLSEYSNIVIELVYKRAPGSSAWTLFVPLLAVIWITIISPLIDPRNLEPKVALPASVVLSLVFLQQGYRQMLPASISYLTFMDKIYAIAYVITFIVFIEAVATTNMCLRVDPRLWKRVYPVIRKREKNLHCVLLCVLILLPPILWFLP
jgi:hypothetical protein